MRGKNVAAGMLIATVLSEFRLYEYGCQRSVLLDDSPRWGSRPRRLHRETTEIVEYIKEQEAAAAGAD